MSWNPYPILPTGALRDLRGITRALYRVALDADPRDEARLHALEEIGRALRAAHRQAQTHPGTIQHQNAWAAADGAVTALKRLIGDSPPLAELVAATGRLLARPGSMVPPLR